MLLLQTTLVATGRRALHRTLGMSALLLAPAIVAGMVLIVSQSWQGVASIPAGVDPQIVREARHGAANFLVVQIRIVVLFTAFMLWAVATRRTDPDTHKRMMLLATFALMSASVGRMRWLPGYDFPATSFAPASFGPAHLYHLGLLAPALAHDILRRGRPHRAYLIGLGLILSTMLATQLLWDYPWWMTAARRLTGVPDMIR